MGGPAGRAARRVVQTRHGDLMLLAEFLRTRVLELAVHGLDLAAALDRGPWMTAPAAAVTEDLLLPAAAAAGLHADTGWDQVTLIAALTGQAPGDCRTRPSSSRPRVPGGWPSADGFTGGPPT